MAQANTTTAAAAAAKEPESKSAAFSRLGVARMNKALAALKGVEKMANKSTYEYTDEQVAKITAALDGANQRVKDAFAGKKASDGGFAL